MKVNQPTSENEAGKPGEGEENEAGKPGEGELANKTLSGASGSSFLAPLPWSAPAGRRHHHHELTQAEQTWSCYD